jgi:hypothetical protein
LNPYRKSKKSTLIVAADLDCLMDSVAAADLAAAVAAPVFVEREQEYSLRLREWAPRKWKLTFEKEFATFAA